MPITRDSRKEVVWRSSVRQGFCSEAGSRDLFKRKYAPLSEQFMEFTSYFPLHPWGGRGQGEGGYVTANEATPPPVSSPRRGEGIYLHRYIMLISLKLQWPRV